MKYILPFILCIPLLAQNKPAPEPPSNNPPAVAKKQDPKSRDLFFACGKDDEGCHFTFSQSGNITLSIEDEHGCNPSFRWDEASKACAMHIVFVIEGGIITCSPVAQDSGMKEQHMICWYKPIAKEKNP